MSNFKDLSNQRFGYLLVQKLDNNPNNKTTKWLCKCDCGNHTVVRGADLKTGHTSSCGCKKHEPSHVIHSKHGTRIYNIWKSMKRRCYNKNEPNFKNYGGRNIKVCDEWKNDFQSFYDWAMRNGYSDNLTIDRINVNGNYEPSNCRWITISEQSINKTNTVYLEINGISKPLKEWCEIYNVPYYLAQQRYKKLLKNNIVCEDLSIIFTNRKLYIEKMQTPSTIKKYNDYRERPIIQYDSSFNFVKEWTGIKEIKQFGGFNKNAVLNCCYGLSKTHKGFIWRYKNDNYPKYKSK